MLFNTFGFIFVYLPVVLIGFFGISRMSRHWAAVWLALVSLVFYGIWDYRYLPLLLGSIAANFWISGRIMKAQSRARKHLLTAAVIVNLLLLGWYKYANFFISTVDQLGDFQVAIVHVVLPIGISFFTFTQIAFLVDTYQGKVSEYNFSHYMLFVTYFPHLIAGPVLHHKEMMPQFKDPSTYRFSADNFAIGLSIFVIGLAKKVLIADNIAPLANAVFEPVVHPALIESWIGVIAYSMQLYYDFSGYSDMAIGLSLLFGVRLPYNFDSPYKSRNIIEFWRRWHMTLSRFLRDYLYIPLGGNKDGALARYRNLILTMVLGGLWHGAGWTFVIWGTLHGIYIALNHFWHHLRARAGWGLEYGWAGQFGAWLLTMFAVIAAWVFFRAPDVATARDVLSGMAGLNGLDLPSWSKARLEWLSHFGAVRFEGIRWIDFGSIALPLLALSVVVAVLFPNSQQIMRGLSMRADTAPLAGQRGQLVWRTSAVWLGFLSVLFLGCVFSLNRATEFLYFQF